ncbi:MAG: hypothetical protein U1D70_08105 [Methylobacter sp.]|nr:hypothetical protein [Methylobacter sp.]MDP2427956.1 hypothetical protein [Methylobacter sp.]MDP3054216.1 hypothetical protein [Methylobacter sp.]MDP3361131.1 hypothetical protein [Methylobacter sp.]MDZ4218973.1 hypothetical protein [Methylobacter sp.]
MSLSQRKRVILVKPEGTYGTDSVPTAAEAVLCSNLDITPLDGSSVERNNIQPYFGQSGSIRVENFVSMTFDTEIAGSGTAATAPEWGPLLKASNFSETVTASPITGTGTAGTTSSITLAAGASAVNDFYTGMSISITDGTGVGQTREIIGYVGSTKVATVANLFTVAPDATSAYSIGANVMYVPNSDFGTATANTSVSIYFNVDGVRHVLLGARGTPSFDLSAKVIPKIKWKFIGLLGTITDEVLPSADFAGWQTPVTTSTANTTDINLLGYTGAVLQTLTFDIANDVKYRQLIGSEWVMIGDRKPAGNVSIEAVTVATKDWWTVAKTAGTGVFCVKHGQVAGNIVGFTAPKVQLTNPKYSDSDGVTMLDFGMDFIPSSAAGNDEIRICCK